MPPVVEGEALRNVHAALLAQVLGRQVRVLAVAQLIDHLVQPLRRLLLQLLLLDGLGDT